MRFLADRTAAQ